MKVKAAISVAVGEPLAIDDLDIGDPGPTHVIVKQFATGVCHSQINDACNDLAHGEIAGRAIVTF